MKEVEIWECPECGTGVRVKRDFVISLLDCEECYECGTVLYRDSVKYTGVEK